MTVMENLENDLCKINYLITEPSMVLIMALMSSEYNIIVEPDLYSGDKDKILRYVITVKNDCKDHHGDCLGMPASCSLCHVMDHYNDVIRASEEANSIWSGLEPEELIHQMIQVYLATQPKKIFATSKEFQMYMQPYINDPTQFILKIKELQLESEYEINISKRISKWNNNDSYKDMVDGLLNFTTNCLSLSENELKDLWTKHNSNLSEILI